MSVVKPKPKQLLWPIKKDRDNPVSQSKLEVLHVADSAIGFGFTSYWLKKWRENFEPITK